MLSDVSGPADAAGLPKAEFAFPGRLRDRLVAAILDGSKTSTTGLAVEYELQDEPLPQVGDRSVLVDSDDQPIAVLEVTSVRVVPLVEVDLTHARDEGEGHQTVPIGATDTRASSTARICGQHSMTRTSRWTTQLSWCSNAFEWRCTCSTEGRPRPATRSVTGTARPP